MTLIIFILVLSVLVLVHEFGHFIVAKRGGVKVEEFGLGLPLLPKIFSFRIGETLYSIYPVLFGGFVRLYGEEKLVAIDRERAFSSKPRWLRASVIVAGVVMNFFLAVVAFSILYSLVGVPRKTDEVRVIGVLDNSPAKNSGLALDDQILKIDGEKISTNESFIQLVEKKKGKEISVAIKNKTGEVKEIKITPRENPPEGEGPIGVVITDSEQYFPPPWQRPFVGAWYGLQEALHWGAIVFQSLGSLFTTLFTTASLPKDLAGPVGIFQITGTVASQGGFLAVLQLLGILSVNLAILNIIPFPALDGGRLLFVIIDAVLGKTRSKDLLQKIEEKANMVGFALLMVLLISITFQDFKRLNIIPQIVEFFQNVK